MYPTLLYDFVTFWARIGLVLVKMKPSWAASAEFVSEWQPLHPLPELVDSNSKQQPYPWMRPEAAHCSLEASESESCCQATAYRWGGVWGGGRSSRVLHCCPRPCLSFVIIASRSDLPGLELLILSKHQHFSCAGPTWESYISCHWPPLCNVLRGKTTNTSRFSRFKPKTKLTFLILQFLLPHIGSWG